MSGSRRPTWLRLPSSPAGRAGSAMMSMVVLATVLAVGAGVGYSVARPLLGSGSAFLPWQHVVVHTNGESGQADAQSGPVAGGTEPLQTVQLPDGRVVSVNKQTGAITLINAATMAASRPLPGDRASAPGLEAVATDSGGHLVNNMAGTVQALPAPGAASAPPAVRVAGGIRMAVPSGNSVWVLTDDGRWVAEVSGGHVLRRFQLGEALSGITVADGHPVVVTARGKAYTVDSDQPHPIGELGLAGPNVALGSWRGSGQYVLAVDTKTGRVAVLDPRGEGRPPARAKLPVRFGTRLGAPVVLGKDVYVPDFTGSRLWRVKANTGDVQRNPLRVPRKDRRDFDLQVSGGHVWANSQYDPTALIVDRDGREHTPTRAPARAHGGRVYRNRGRTGGSRVEFRHRATPRVRRNRTPSRPGGRRTRSGGPTRKPAASSSRPGCAAGSSATPPGPSTPIRSASSSTRTRSRAARLRTGESPSPTPIPSACRRSSARPRARHAHSCGSTR